MDVKEAERVNVAKPVASRPSCSTFSSFSELLAGAINDGSPPTESSPTTVAAIRPKTARFKPAMNHAAPAGFLSSQADLSETAPCNSSDETPEPDTRQSVIYKPMAKLASKSTVSLLANMGNCFTSQPQPRQSMQACLQYVNTEKFKTNLSSSLVHIQSSTPHARADSNQTGKVVSHNQEEDTKTLPSTTTSNANGDRPSCDGYNWRKYGQKQVKGSEYPRSYYKCTYPNGPVKKKVERSFDGQIAEIVYKGEHNHSKSQPAKRNSALTQESGPGLVSVALAQDANNNLWSNSDTNFPDERINESRIENQNDTGVSAHSAYQVKAPQANDSGVTGAINADGGTPENSFGLSGNVRKEAKDLRQKTNPEVKKRKKENQSNEAAVSEESLIEPRVVVQNSTDSEIVGDGFRWRKYGQKVVKGNRYPRSYYRCTNSKCNMRKHVERAIDNPIAFITTYEGKHNHETPMRNTGASVSSERDPLSKDKTSHD